MAPVVVEFPETGAREIECRGIDALGLYVRDETRRVGHARPGHARQAQRQQAGERRDAPSHARSASTIHLSENSGAETRITARIAKPASRNSCSRFLRETREIGPRPMPNFPKVCVITYRNEYLWR